MRSIWKGAIGFGLVSVPVKLYSATEEHGVRLHQVHAEDGGRIRMKRTCERCGKQVGFQEVAKGYEDEEGRAAILTDTDMAELPLPSKKLIDVLAFVPSEDIDPLQLSNPYYISAESAAANKPYVLLREALKQTGQVAVTKITLRTRESLALLRVHDDLLVLQTMYWPDEIRSGAGLAPPESVSVRSQELNMAASLMDALSEDFDIESLHDEYQRALDELVAARLGKKAAPAAVGTAPAPDNVIDLMSALQASIDARAGEQVGGEKAAQSAAPGGAGGKRERAESGRKTPAKKAAPGKQASSTKKTGETKKSTGGAKKTAGKSTGKAAAKKTSTKKAAEKTPAKPAAKKTAAKKRASA